MSRIFHSRALASVATTRAEELLLDRRAFLAGSASLAATAALVRRAAAAEALELRVLSRSIDVGGKAASILSIVRPDGTPGAVVGAGHDFAVDLTNDLKEATIVHWHGQTPPPAQDGVTETGFVGAMAPNETRRYRFAARPGTHWMHSHQGLQEQRLLAAPLIVRTAQDEAADVQDVAVLLQDFSFKSPEEIFAALGKGSMQDMPGMAMFAMDMGQTAGSSTKMSGMNMSGMDTSQMNMSGMDMGSPASSVAPDLNDVAYDAFLANERTLEDPLVVRTERNGRVRLRLINASASTAFWIDLGALPATLVAVDGNDVVPFVASRFPLAQAQRIDLLVTVGSGQVLPVLARVEGRRDQTGIVLAAPDAPIAKQSVMADGAAPAVDLSMETRLVAAAPLAQRPPDRTLAVHLTGTMMPYAWGMSNPSDPTPRPLTVGRGERVALRLINETTMAHPMHLHGHHFQVTGVGGQPFLGARRDTVLVPASGNVDIAFDADNPGRWLFHCHNLYHMAAGMMTQVVYS